MIWILTASYYGSIDTVHRFRGFIVFLSTRGFMSSVCKDCLKTIQIYIDPSEKRALSAGGRAAEGSSLPEPKRLYDHAPTCRSTWTGHAALPDSTYLQPDGGHILVTLPSTD